MTLEMPADSTTVKPCKRSAVKNWLYAADTDSGLSLFKFMVPLTRGSTTMLRPVITPMVRATSAISALLKFKVTPALLRVTVAGLAEVPVLDVGKVLEGVVVVVVCANALADPKTMQVNAMIAQAAIEIVVRWNR